MKLLTEIKLLPGYLEVDLKTEICKRLDISIGDIKNYEIIKMGIDARHKPNVFYVLNVALDLGTKTNGKIKSLEDITPDHDGLRYEKRANCKRRPIIVGFGPSGMFCALALARAGLEPIVLEQGKCVEERQIDVNNFWKSRILNKHSNVQFGEGGAGTFSDGKLNTNLNNLYCKKIINEFILHGAPNEIYYKNKPHIGTDNLKIVVSNIRHEIEKLGGKIIFNAKFSNFSVKNNSISSISYVDLKNNAMKNLACEALILAVGHSAIDVFELLKNQKVAMHKKPFAVGVRIEHPQDLIDKIQYGMPHGKFLPPADYKVAVHLPNGRSVFSFCMCPGGCVVASSSEENTIVTNGMSEFARDKKFANSALLVNVNPEDVGDDILSGFDFQEQIERSAFCLSGANYNAPAQNLLEFINGTSGENMNKCSYMPGVTSTDLSKCLPKFVCESLKDGIVLINKKMNGFIDKTATLIAPETRSSCPVQLDRAKDYTCTVLGLYACGEGAGYAGGIISSAVDGVKCAESVMQFFE